MRTAIVTRATIAIISILLSATACSREANTANTEQVADSVFVPRVQRPAYPTDGPRVSFDEAHNNYHTMAGRYQPFVDLLTLDGYRFTANKAPFSMSALGEFDVLVMVNAAGGETEDAPDSILGLPAFEAAEVEAVREAGLLDG